MDQRFGKRLSEARKYAGHETAEDAIARYGWNKHTYKAHESGSRIPRDAKRYAKAYKVREEWLILNLGEMLTESQKADHLETRNKKPVAQPKREFSSIYPLNMHDVVPLYGPAIADPEKIYITGDNVNVIGERPRPPELQGVRDGFRMLVVDDLMEPRHFAGEEVSVHPFKRPAVNDDCVIEMEPDGNAQTIRRYLGESAKEVKFMQWNPRKEITIPKKEIRRMYAVVR